MIKLTLEEHSAGTGQNPPAVLQSMVAPEFTAYSAGNTLEVEPQEHAPASASESASEPASEPASESAPDGPPPRSPTAAPVAISGHIESQLSP